MKIGYARVSTDDQELGSQVMALEAYGCDRIITDKISGTKASRPGLDEALSLLKKGDALVVWKLDRLGRSLLNIAALADRFRRDGVDLISLTESVDTTHPMGRFFFSVLAAMAELERDMISERTKAGLSYARSQGKKLGTPRKVDVKAMNEMLERGLSIDMVAYKLKVCRRTIQREMGRCEKD